MDKNSKIYIAGHRGLVGSAIFKKLQQDGYTNLIHKTHNELDLTNQSRVAEFFVKEMPEYVFLAAAKVGGIHANNTYRADFMYSNLQIQNNIIHQSYLTGVKKLLFLGSISIYPKNAPQPLEESCLLTGELEYTNEPYAIAKIAGAKMCESYNLQYKTNFITVMPTNLYGANDNFDLENSHVLPAIIRKIFLAKLLDEDKYLEIAKNLSIESSEKSIIESYLTKYGMTKLNGQTVLNLWGSGKAYREFLHVDDMADACVFVMNNVNFMDLCSGKTEIKNTHINIGTGKDLTIKELATIIQQLLGYQGLIQFDVTKPDGTMRKLQDISKLNRLGWRSKIELVDGIKCTIDHYLSSNNG